VKFPPSIFVAGLARSGTTLFQSIFCRHPNVFSFPETHFFEAVNHLLLFDRQLTLADLESLGAEIIRRDGFDKDFWLDLKKRVSNECLENLNLNSVFLCLIETYRSRLSKNATSIALEKTPGHVFQLSSIIKMFPDSRVFLLRRNPRDYANSIAKCSWGPGNIDQIATLWSQTIELIGQYQNHNPDRRSRKKSTSNNDEMLPSRWP
jgi:hypothetical protein